MCNSECVPAVYTRCVRNKGQYADQRRAMQIAREELTKRDGPCPPDKALCRHTCDNDSTAPNGFVCTLHTVWGTKSENELDKPEELRKKGGKIGGPKGGKKTCSIERTCPHCGRTIKGPAYFLWHGDKCKSGSKISNSIERTCPHCGRTIKGRVYFRWHGENCKQKGHATFR